MNMLGAPTRTRHQKLEPYLFLRVAYTATSASQHSKNTNDCMPMCDKLCPNIRGGAWATLPLTDTYIWALPDLGNQND